MTEMALNPFANDLFGSLAVMAGLLNIIVVITMYLKFRNRSILSLRVLQAVYQTTKQSRELLDEVHKMSQNQQAFQRKSLDQQRALIASLSKQMEGIGTMLSASASPKKSNFGREAINGNETPFRRYSKNGNNVHRLSDLLSGRSSKPKKVQQSFEEQLISELERKTRQTANAQNVESNEKVAVNG